MTNRAIPEDVRRLVIAARNVAFDRPTQAELRALDIASEAFADRVPWDDDPAGLGDREEAPACLNCGGKGYTEYEGGDGEGYPSRPEIEACSCREEAQPVEPWGHAVKFGANGWGLADDEDPDAIDALKADPEYQVIALYEQPLRQRMRRCG